MNMMRRYLRHAAPWSILLVLLVTATSCSGEQPLYTGIDVEIIGHRGAPEEAPENTIAAFDAAAELGADALEVDVCVTRDGVPILWHDCEPDTAIALARQTGAEGLPYVPTAPLVGDPMRRPIWELSYDEVQEHYGYEGLDPLEDTPDDGLIPTLSHFFDWWSRHPEIGAVYFDSKVGKEQRREARLITASLLEELAEHEEILAGRKSYLLSVHRDHVELYLEEVEQGGAEDVIVVWDHEEEQGALENMESLGLRHASLGMGFEPSWEFRDFVREARLLVEARRAGRLDWVVVWTFDDADEIEALIELGVDGIMTNRPGQVISSADP